MDIEDLRDKLEHSGIPNNNNYYAFKQINAHPDKVALKYPTIENNNVIYRELTFNQFRTESLRWANGLILEGFKVGDRIILLFPVSVELYQVIFACFHLGITPVFVDLSMGTRKLIQAIKDSKAKGIFSIDKLLKFKYFIPAMWGKKCFSLDRKRFLIKNLSDLYTDSCYSKNQLELDNKTTALITFTSGSTGKPKGANRTIEVLLNQKIVSEYMWPHNKNEIDMPAFPMIVLQNLGCGVSSVLPAIDFQNFLEMKPEIVYSQLLNQKVSRFSAQPFFIEHLCDYMLESKLDTPTSIRSIVIGGAVVSKRLCKKIQSAFSNIEVNIVYGSTEAEPIAHASIEEFLSSDSRGLLLGKVVESLRVKILSINKEPIDISDDCYWQNWRNYFMWPSCDHRVY